MLPMIAVKNVKIAAPAKIMGEKDTISPRSVSLEYIIAALNSANEAAVKARATTLPPMLLAVIVMAEAAMQIIGLAMYWGAPYLDYDIALQLYGMFGYLTGSVLLHMLSLLFSAVSGILFSVVTLRYRREVSAAMEAE